MKTEPRPGGSVHKLRARTLVVALPAGRGSVFAHTTLVFCLQQLRVRMFLVLTDFDRSSVERFKQATEEKLREVRCPDHRQAPRLRFQGTSLRDISISISGCCQKVMELANSRISSVPITVERPPRTSQTASAG